MSFFTSTPSLLRDLTKIANSKGEEKSVLIDKLSRDSWDDREKDPNKREEFSKKHTQEFAQILVSEFAEKKDLELPQNFYAIAQNFLYTTYSPNQPNEFVLPVVSAMMQSAVDIVAAKKDFDGSIYYSIFRPILESHGSEYLLTKENAIELGSTLVKSVETVDFKRTFKQNSPFNIYIENLKQNSKYAPDDYKYVGIIDDIYKNNEEEVIEKIAQFQNMKFDINKKGEAEHNIALQKFYYRTLHNLVGLVPQ